MGINNDKIINELNKKQCKGYKSRNKNRNLDRIYKKLVDEKEQLLNHPWVAKLDNLNKQIDKINDMIDNDQVPKKTVKRIRSYKL